MSEELIQRNLIKAPEKMGDWDFYNIGATTLKALKEANIIADKDYETYETKKPDALVIRKPQVLVAIEYKQPSELKTKKKVENAITQEIGTARALCAMIYIVTDGQKTLWINPATGNQIELETGEKVDYPFNKDDDKCIELVNKIINSISPTNDVILPSIIVDPLPLAQKVWQDLWTVSGATPENCLYTFVEIFIFKYLSDLGVLTGLHSFSHLVQQYKTNTDNEVLEYYASSVRVKIKDCFPGNPKDNTTIINGTIFVSKDDKAVSGYATVFKKILERFNDFGTLENIDYDFKSKLFETFLKESISKKNWGQFFTPLKVVRAVVNMVELRPGITVCDPACGVGKFLLEPILENLHRYFKIENNKLVPQINLFGFDKGFDKDEQKTIILAKANMLIYLSSLIKEHPSKTQQFAQLFNDTFLLQTNSILGTLAKPVNNQYDLILTNPPYVMSGSSNLKEEISKQTELKNYYSINAMGIEGLFMEWIVRALKPGGKAFIIIPDGIMNRINDERLRNFILEECLLDAIISLPLNTFFTTNKKTYIMAITKKEPVMINGVMIKERQKTPVFTYLCSEIGETRDVYRFEIDQNDLTAASDLYNMFKGVRERFTTEDKRCKIVSIEHFYNGSHWSVERWWTQDEKIELGIEDEEDRVDLEGFISLINDIADTITEYDEPLRNLEKKKSPLRKSKMVHLSDESIFDLFLGKRLLRKNYINNKGNIPIYSANVYDPFLFSNQSNINDFSIPHVIWGIDGEFEFNSIAPLQPFGTTDHCGAIRIKDTNINPVYLSFILKLLKKQYGFDRGLRASLSNMRQIVVPIPVDEEGDFDYSKQEQIANEIKCINQFRSVISEKRQRLGTVYVTLANDEYKFSWLPLTDIFTLIRGKSKYTKKYGNSNKGNFPVYSASSQKPLTQINTYDFDGHYLSWATNGFAGTIKVITGKFSINGDRGILLVNHDFSGRISFDYIKFTMEPVFRSLAKGRRGDRGIKEFTKLYPSMLQDIAVPLPVNEYGDIDVSIQNELAEKYRTVEQIRSDLLTQIDKLLYLSIDYF